MRVITKSEAKAQGLKTYFLGTKCKRGSVAERNVANGLCRCRKCRDYMNDRRAAKYRKDRVGPDGKPFREVCTKARSAAKAAGEKLYFTGKPCSRGHVAQRRVGDGGCIVCKAITGSTKTALAKKRLHHRRNKEQINLGRASYRDEHRGEIREAQRKWYYENREEVIARRLALTTEPGRPCPFECECCGKPNNNGRQLCLDHDHKTGKFRGWLCDLCNTGIGKLGDDLEGLDRAIRYLSLASFDQIPGRI